MNLFARLLSSNLVLLMVTFVSGMAAGVLLNRDRCRIALKVVLTFVAACITLSFLFTMGEVYQYTPYYKRAFAVFGDDVATVIVFLALGALFYNRPGWFYMAVTALALTVGKTSIILFAIGLAVLIAIHRGQRVKMLKRTVAAVLIAVVFYFAAGGISNLPTAQRWGVQAVAAVNGLEAPNPVNPYTIAELNKQIRQQDGWLYAGIIQHANACPAALTCFTQQSRQAMRGRIISSIGGLWMTLQGGFRGEEYPNTPDEFADMMMQANPWGINDRLQLTREQWYNMAMPQNPFLHFGSGYGWLGLLALLLAWGAVVVIGIRNIVHGQRGEGTVYPVYFAVIVLLNHTQTYITSFSSLLFTLGLCTGMILLTAWRRHQVLEITT